MIYGHQYTQKALARFGRDETYATTLLAILLDRFGSVEFLEWDPETLALEFKSVFGVPWEETSPVARDKVLALTSVYVSDAYFHNLESFLAVANALSGAGVDPRIFDPATVVEAAWAATEVGLNGIEGEYGPEIAAYIGVQARMEGFETLPAMLSWGETPRKARQAAEAVAEGGSELFAAGYSRNRDDVAAVEAEVAAKRRELVGELAAFPFMRKEAADGG
jgi:hypothetical protein